MEVVAGLKHRLTDMSHREDEAYQQMKKGIELVEQAQLEQTQVIQTATTFTIWQNCSTGLNIVKCATLGLEDHNCRHLYDLVESYRH